MTTWILVAAAMLLPLDYVTSSYGLERARIHDRAMLRLLLVAAVALLAVDLVAGAVLVLGLLAYVRDDEGRALLLAAALAGVWMLGPLLAREHALLAVAWTACALGEGAFTVWHWGARRGWWPQGELAARLVRHAAAGLHGQHTLFAGYLVLVAPLAYAVHPAAGLVLAGLVLAVSCWTAWLALLTATFVLLPGTLPWLLALLATAVLLLLPKFRARGDSWLNVTPRGDSLDSLILRWQSWRSLVRLMGRWDARTWILGRGGRAVNLDLRRARVVKWVTFPIGTAHNDVVEVAYAHGLAGLALLGTLAWRVGAHLSLGDPWSAAVLAGAVVGCGSPALHYPSIGGPFWVACAIVAAR